MDYARLNDIAEREWKVITDKVKDEDQWESAVYDALMRKKKASSLQRMFGIK